VSPELREIGYVSPELGPNSLLSMLGYTLDRVFNPKLRDS